MIEANASMQGNPAPDLAWARVSSATVNRTFSVLAQGMNLGAAAKTNSDNASSCGYRAGSSMKRPELLLSRLGMFAIVPIGVLFLALAVRSVWSTKAWIADAVEAQGTVIEMVRKRDSDGGYMYSPLVRFRSIEGKSIEFQSNWWTNPPAYRTGQAVTVLYDRTAPEAASIHSFFTLWCMTLLLTFIGMVISGTGVAMIVLSPYAAQALAKPATG
jgi:hypothetical protein